jgi:hypothetical protein
MPRPTRTLAAAAVIFACLAPDALALDRAGYLALADRLQRHLDPYWNEPLGRYEPGPGATTTQVNGDLLLVHALAARHGHTGPARQDERGRRIARFLTGPGAWTEHPREHPEWAKNGIGWRAAPDRDLLHPVFVTEAAEGLAQAHQGLALDEDTRVAIAHQLGRVARSRWYAWPAIRLNQFNWPVAVFAAHATVSGDLAMLRDGLRRHLDRFLAEGERNLGPGLHFFYMPGTPSARVNIDTPEYANIVLGFARHYGAARRAGMPRPQRLGLLRAWVRRVIAGGWTHAGSLNWDTGLGFRRWHQRKKVPLAQQALLGIAAERELQPDPRWGAWAKWILDRGLEHYADLADETAGIPEPLAYGVNVLPQTRGDAVLAAARTAANALRALDAGLGERSAQEPPPLYAFDPDTGRLAVTTPDYNTAIVPDNRGAFPYGGIDLARLLDSRQRPVAGIGGRPPAAFGVVVRDARGIVLAGQDGRRRAPVRGVAAHPTARRAYAGPFSGLRVSGEAAARGRRVRSAYGFHPHAIDARWTVTAERGDRVTATFPSWGPSTGLRADSVPVGATPIPITRGTRLEIGSGYSVTLRHVPAGATVRAVPTRPQPSAPSPGPSLEVRFSGTLAVRLVVEPR